MSGWRTLSSRLVYANPWLSVREDQVALPSGATITYGVASTGRCVGMLPFLDPGTVLLVRQYRYLAGRITWEMPTGGVHAGETPEAAAQRELAEEAGFAAGRLVPVSVMHTSKSILDETAHLYLAADLRPHELPPDETEVLERRRVPFERALELVIGGEVLDAMTIVAVLLAARLQAAGRLAAVLAGEPLAG